MAGRNTQLALAGGILLLFASSACAPATAPEEYVPVTPPAAPTTTLPAFDWPTQAWLDRSLDLSFYDEAELAQIAQSPVLIIALRLLLSEEAQAPLAQIRALNPEIVFVGVLDNLMFHEYFGDPQHRARFPLGGQIYDLYAPRVARTTTGAIPLMWNAAPMVNPYRNGSFDQGLVDRLLDLICTAAQRHPDLVHGIFHDYLSGTPFIYPEQGDVGQVDLDGDGVGVADDPQDRAAWVGYQQAVVDGLQQRFGGGLIQIGNGRLPHENAQIAASLAGIAYENFPTTVWAYSDRAGMDLMLAHCEPGWLTPRRGRLWSLLWDRSGSKLEFCRAASGLSGQFFVRNDRHGFAGLDPMHGSMGQPVGPLSKTLNEDDSWTYRRLLQNGNAIIDFAPSGVSTRRELSPL